ncbi:MAG: hypothetical protein HOL98_11230 [Gammaproteobacteria bacterium]|nr:hypothetical protein [Gammaproteobacteria bacterium]MBT5603799.1 hypothetical protein [Gammaproteobacteria bacterium]MBT6243838.1 hypothetical protein [Gammaproteobacteria bacterium]
MMTISLDARVLERHPSGVEVHLDGSGCSACSRHCSARQGLMIPGKFAHDRIKISLSSGVLGKLLVNSLYLPLAMFVIFAWLASCVTASEIVQGSAAVAGLALGIIRCRQMTFNDIKIE